MFRRDSKGHAPTLKGGPRSSFYKLGSLSLNAGRAHLHLHRVLLGPGKCPVASALNLSPAPTCGCPQHGARVSTQACLAWLPEWGTEVLALSDGNGVF